MIHSTSTRTTIALPTALLAATDRAVTDGKAKSRNELIARAIQRELALIRRAEIDADLSQMAQDTEYQAEVLQIEAEFAVSRVGDYRGSLSIASMEKISTALALAMDLPKREDL
jgi:metal-responsive CopG/Arc/MetJ family transcriptional regulator